MNKFKSSNGLWVMCYVIVFLLLLLITHHSSLITQIHAQSFNVSSVYQVNDAEALSGDIIISKGEQGLTRSNVSYDSRIFGVLNEEPTVVLREATTTAKPVIRLGDDTVNITDYNGKVKKGDYVTTSPILGKGMRAGQSGYVVGIALKDAILSEETSNFGGRNIHQGTVKVAIKIEYAEITTPRNTLRFLNELNAALFRNIQDPEKFTITIRYIIAGLIALLAFVIGGFTIAHSISKTIEAIGRNPLAQRSIILSEIIQVGVVALLALATVVTIFIIVRI